MRKCRFNLVLEGLWKCRRCSREVHSSSKPISRCGFRRLKRARSKRLTPLAPKGDRLMDLVLAIRKSYTEQSVPTSSIEFRYHHCSKCSSKQFKQCWGDPFGCGLDWERFKHRIAMGSPPESCKGYWFEGDNKRENEK